MSDSVEGCLSKVGRNGEIVGKGGGFFDFFLEKKEWIAAETAKKGKKQLIAGYNKLFED